MEASENGRRPYGMLAMSDSGPGLDDQSWAHLYEPFFTTKARWRGLGLGLAAVYGIVRQSGGRLWAYSQPGKGATFRHLSSLGWSAIPCPAGAAAPGSFARRRHHPAGRSPRRNAYRHSERFKKAWLPRAGRARFQGSLADNQSPGTTGPAHQPARAGTRPVPGAHAAALTGLVPRRMCRRPCRARARIAATHRDLAEAVRTGDTAGYGFGLVIAAPVVDSGPGDTQVLPHDIPYVS